MPPGPPPPRARGGGTRWGGRLALLLLGLLQGAGALAEEVPLPFPASASAATGFLRPAAAVARRVGAVAPHHQGAVATAASSAVLAVASEAAAREAGGPLPRAGPAEDPLQELPPWRTVLDRPEVSTFKAATGAPLSSAITKSAVGSSSKQWGQTFLLQAKTLFVPTNDAFESFMKDGSEVFKEMRRVYGKGISYQRFMSLVLMHGSPDRLPELDKALDFFGDGYPISTFDREGEGFTLFKDPASGEITIRDSCNTWSKVVAGPMRYVDQAMDERTVYLIDNLIIPQQWCDNGL